IALVLGFAEGNQKRDVIDLVKRAGFSTAPMIVRFLMQAYGEFDEDAALMKFLLDPKGHNWAYIVADGGTFTYENWRGRNRQDPGARSESHPVGAYGGVIAIQHYVLGVQTTKPQYAHVKIRPHPGELKFARGTIPTQRGPIHVDWKNDTKTETFSLTVELPCNVHADVFVPRRSETGTTVEVDGTPRRVEDAGRYLRIRNVGSGSHRFVSRPDTGR
ncbi:MAG: alpha-L-rhamnosidase C-terminal domain-containing protein, partial [Planctomycetota bacterium]